MIVDTENGEEPTANYNQNPAVNLEKFYKSLSKENMDLLYLTLTHLTHINEQFLATHAFGMKMLKHPSFYPFGNGISSLGYDVIEKCYSMTNHKNEYRPVLIDVKHLGLKSRQDYYAFRKTLIQKEKKYEKIPIIASHIGVTGYTVNEWKNALKRNSCTVYNYEGTRAVSIEMEKKICGKWGSFVNNDFTFNPWSINLMDEDITEILNSNGIIGMSLDVRILGFQSEYGISLTSENEYLSTADFHTHFPQITVKNLPLNTMESMIVENESWLIPTKEDRHPLSFCFNIIHIIQVGLLKTDIAEPWNQICLGSDFDGLIEPLKISPDISSLEELEANMIKWIPVAEKAYVNENGGTRILFGKSTAELKKIVRGIMYENGKNFIDRWLNNFAG
jgi:microsomal dipeptidase-like Zn-dependent dipeptidase